MITEENALNTLSYLAKAPEVYGLETAKTWLAYAQDALSPTRKEIQTAKACIAVAQKLLGG